MAHLGEILPEGSAAMHSLARATGRAQSLDAFLPQGVTAQVTAENPRLRAATRMTGAEHAYRRVGESPPALASRGDSLAPAGECFRPLTGPVNVGRINLEGDNVAQHIPCGNRPFADVNASIFAAGRLPAMILGLAAGARRFDGGLCQTGVCVCNADDRASAIHAQAASS
jgi:hypothetical protein